MEQGRFNGITKSFDKNEVLQFVLSNSKDKEEPHLETLSEILRGEILSKNNLFMNGEVVYHKKSYPITVKDCSNTH